MFWLITERRTVPASGGVAGACQAEADDVDTQAPSARTNPSARLVATREPRECGNSALRPQLGVRRLDHAGDEGQPLVERQERRLHRVDGEPLHVADGVAERLGQV